MESLFRYYRKGKYTMSDLIKLILWPLTALWTLLTLVLALVGRLAAFILGCICLVVGTVLSGTILLSPIGIPIFIIGIVLVLRSIF